MKAIIKTFNNWVPMYINSETLKQWIINYNWIQEK